LDLVSESKVKVPLPVMVEGPESLPI
jgi:hypothetical protein